MGDRPGHEFHGNQWTSERSGAHFAGRVTPEQRDLVAEVQKVLTPDLLKKEWAQNPATPLTGHCYAATEAMYHILGGKAAGYKAVGVKHEGGSHWWLQGPQGEVIDATAGQFKTPVPYEKGVGRGFLTKEPSERARKIIGRVRPAHGWTEARRVGR